MSELQYAILSFILVIINIRPRENRTNVATAERNENPFLFVSPAKHSGTQGSLCLASVCLSVRLSMCLFGSHTSLVVTSVV